MTLVPEEHARFNKYWGGFLGERPQRNRPVDPRSETYGRVNNARASLSRFDRRRHADANGREPMARYRTPGESLDKAIRSLKERLSFTLRLQIIHVAGDVREVAITRDKSIMAVGQYCARCDLPLYSPKSFDLSGVEDQLLDERGEWWRHGIRVLVWWEGRCVSDGRVMVLGPDEELPSPAFIPCTAALERL